ncbi:hypothetical protein PACTADRAFT_77485 [Pachysolen tannophilus NRRL Y-2460]|uniref:Uncharacterized protein n=1 Tax=Pachysolen tannophilus NRRL Y-2460 TaxID=669874 RepID=A0A1E4TQL9_PACTA|nr:hypothetical protein PACTADRAFT_77485 [Pachysolen tannophilus NRRL Y-2460]
MGSLSHSKLDLDKEEVEEIVSGSVVNKLNKISTTLDSFGAETRGIDRVLPEEREKNFTKVCIQVLGLWLSGCGGLTSMSSYFLGATVYGLGLKDSLISGLVSTSIGCAIAAYFSMMGPRSGCRQIVGARFLFGYWFVKFVALVAIIGTLGWSVTNCVLGGQILAAISDDKVPIEVGIVIISIFSFFVAVFGIKQLLRVETFLSVPVFIGVILLYIVSERRFDYPDTVSTGDSITNKGDFLTFFALCYSVTATWGTMASDYYILFPENSSDLTIFCITFFGTLFPTIFGAVIGILIGNSSYYYEPWNEAYEQLGIGGLLNECFKPWNGFGKFVLIVLFLSLISNNIMNTYSAAFSAQLSAVAISKIPRWFLCIAISSVTMIAALVGRNKFSTILGNFLPMLGYWVSIYFILLLEENTIFRRKRFRHLFIKEFENEKKYYENNENNYNFTIWNDSSRLTNGFAAGISFLIGVAGAILGMAQAYYIGPIAKNLGDYGGDLGMWISMGFSGLVYPFLRYFELKKFGR